MLLVRVGFFVDLCLLIIVRRLLRQYFWVCGLGVSFWMIFDYFCGVLVFDWFVGLFSEDVVCFGFVVLEGLAC